MVRGKLPLEIEEGFPLGMAMLPASFPSAWEDALLKHGGLAGTEICRPKAEEKDLSLKLFALRNAAFRRPGQDGDFANLAAQYGFDDVAKFLAEVDVIFGANDRHPAEPPAVLETNKRAVITKKTGARSKKRAGKENAGGKVAKAVEALRRRVKSIKKALGL